MFLISYVENIQRKPIERATDGHLANDFMMRVMTIAVVINTYHKFY